MCEHYEEILARLEQMDKAREESELKEMIAEIKAEIKKINIFLFGNGQPEKSFYAQYSAYRDKLDTHLKFHGGVEGKIWNIAQPILISLVAMVVFGGLFFAFLRPYLESLLQQMLQQGLQ
jgi:hypothetical protein